VTQEIPTYPEDDEILSQLDDPMDLEAFANLMENAHREGVSAADFVREEPKRTSRKTIRRICLKDRKRSLKAVVSSIVRSLWDRPPENPATALNPMFGTGGQRLGGPDNPVASDTPGSNGRG
jgi:hypothetical protein